MLRRYLSTGTSLPRRLRLLPIGHPAGPGLAPFQRPRVSAILVIQVGVLEKLDIIQKSRTEVSASIEANECASCGIRVRCACGTGAGCSLSGMPKQP